MTAACQPACQWAFRSKAALLFSLVVKRAGAALWVQIVPDLLRFAEQGQAHKRTVRLCQGPVE